MSKEFKPGGFGATIKITIDEKYVRFDTNASITLVPIKHIVALTLSGVGSGNSDVVFIGLGTELARARDIGSIWAEKSFEWLSKELNL